VSKQGQTLALTHFNHVEQQVTLAATTAALIVAADALLIGTYVGVIKDFKPFPALGVVWGGLFAGGGVLLIVAFLLALWAALPRLRDSSPGVIPAVQNLLFFEKLRQLSFQEYYTQFCQTSERQWDVELLFQVHAKSQWLATIFRRIRWALVCTMVGTVLALGVICLKARSLPSGQPPPTAQQPTASSVHCTYASGRAYA
jgi:hypothetical protein